jgi:arginyl-tRNA synthetase
MIKSFLQNQLQQSVQSCGYELNMPLILDVPANRSFGDYSSNCSFQMAKNLKKSPKIIAEELSEKLAGCLGDLEFTAVNGFINIKLTDKWLTTRFKSLHREKLEFPKSEQKIILEYVSANPTGPLHIGHGRWAVIGSAMRSLMKFVGMDVSSEFYINDAGNQVNNFYKSVEAAKAGKTIPEDGYHGAYIYDLAKLDEDPLIVNLDSQKASLKDVGAKFDNWFSEKSLHGSGKVEMALAVLKEKGLTYEDEGALWFKSESLGDEKDRVLIKVDGSYTYFAVDIAYHVNKVERGFNRIINIWGADHHGYIARVKAGLSAICGEHFNNETGFKVVLGQLVILMRGEEQIKMSKRTGEIITLDEVVEEIGVDATRYFLVQKSPDTKLEFDLELAKKKSAENPVFYVQYAHARICSILRKLELDGEMLVLDDNVKLNAQEREMMFLCLQVYDELWDSAVKLTPYKLTHYLASLAKGFHLFYEHCPILKAEGDDRVKRVAIMLKVKETIALCLGLLGISAPEQM